MQGNSFGKWFTHFVEAIFLHIYYIANSNNNSRKIRKRLNYNYTNCIFVIIHLFKLKLEILLYFKTFSLQFFSYFTLMFNLIFIFHTENISISFATTRWKTGSLYISVVVRKLHNPNVLKHSSKKNCQ